MSRTLSAGSAVSRRRLIVPECPPDPAGRTEESDDEPNVRGSEMPVSSGLSDS